jgi:hypothetical protein
MEIVALQAWLKRAKRNLENASKNHDNPALMFVIGA